MNWNDPPLSWSELERRLSGRPRPPRSKTPDVVPAGQRWGGTHGLPKPVPPPDTHAYAELHCHSNFSFLDGASHPEELAEEAVRLGLRALAITDHDGFYGVVRFAQAARAVGLETVFGAELTVGATRVPNGVADPEGDHLIVLARGPQGYANLSRALSLAQLRGEKGRPVHDLDELGGISSGTWKVLTACRKGAVNRALMQRGPQAAEMELQRLINVFGRDNVAVEIWDHGDPIDSTRNDALVELAIRARVEPVATNNVHYAKPSGHRLASALASVRARRSLDEMDGWLPASGAAHLRSGAEQARRFARWPGVVAQAALIAQECAFDLKLVAPQLPPFPVPPNHNETSWLRALTAEGARRRYGPRQSERVPGAWAQIDRELQVISKLNFPGYFLIVWDLVEFCRRNDIFCQGRGSAANSAVCYALGITNADAVALGLLFERFLSPGRDGPPDIDIDIESGRREEVIQYVYERYGRHNAAQVANVITYRARSAVRDAAKALGHAPPVQDALSKQVDGWGPLPSAETAEEFPSGVIDLAKQIEGFPRHLGIHSGGMVLCDRPVIEVCPVEWGRMENRSILQWDKEDCATAGLVKFDLLGLGMLTALHEAVDLIKQHYSLDLDLALLPQDDAVYEMLSRADSVGVFQVESRAQMATLPRLKPSCFYDLVVEVALIRPGPIQGGSVHPYLRRRNGREPVTYAHPLLEGALKKTLGVPLFQEQLMQIAIDVAGFTPGDADELRQAMSAKRSHERMARLKDRFYAGMAVNGVVGEVADEIWDKLEAFSSFGFPESHSVSFAYLVYSSAWIKCHYPAAFCASLLRAQPMGFWSPHTLIADARRHGVVVKPPDVNASDSKASLEALSARDFALRLGIDSVRTIGSDLAEKIAAGRPYSSVEDVVGRAGLSRPQAEALATSGSFGCFEASRRKTLWTAGAAAGAVQGRLPGITPGLKPPDLPSMTARDEMAADLWSTSVVPNGSPMHFVRPSLTEAGVKTSAQLNSARHRSRVKVAGVVTHRQRPSTAQGLTFLNLEDETGLVNVICSLGVWQRHKRVATMASAMVVTGRLERVDGVVNLVAEKLEALDLGLSLRSRDFR